MSNQLPGHCEAAENVASGRLNQRFSRQYRLTRTDEYSSVFDFRRAIRGKLFMVHYLPAARPGREARLGLVVGKKQLKRAVDRNLVKRILRENFRLRRFRLAGYDLVIRLMIKPADIDRKVLKEEILFLLDKLRPRQAHPETGLSLGSGHSG